jgi:type II secretory pathway component PulF
VTLKQRDDEVLRLNGELTQLSVSHEDLRQSLEEQEATILNLRQVAEDARASSRRRGSKSKVGYLLSVFLLVDSSF